MNINLVTREELMQEIKALHDRIEKLEKAAAGPKTEKLLTSREAAAYLRITPESLSRIRRRGAIKGLKLNEKEYAYDMQQLNQYLTRYNKPIPQ